MLYVEKTYFDFVWFDSFPSARFQNGVLFQSMFLGRLRMCSTYRRELVDGGFGVEGASKTMITYAKHVY